VKLRRVYEDWLLLGFCQDAVGNQEQALIAFEQAGEINPFRPEIHTFLGRAYRRQGQVEKAEKHFRLAAALTREPPPR
jgi:tetratricopeptide (TPR) repeat protein